MLCVAYKKLPITFIDMQTEENIELFATNTPFVRYKQQTTHIHTLDERIYVVFLIRDLLHFSTCFFLLMFAFFFLMFVFSLMFLWLFVVFSLCRFMSDELLVAKDEIGLFVTEKGMPVRGNIVWKHQPNDIGKINKQTNEKKTNKIQFLSKKKKNERNKKNASED
jgi:hypothetical protein